jgi:hypothetical protein
MLACSARFAVSIAFSHSVLIKDDGLFLSTILNPLDLRILTVPHKSLTAKAMKSIRGGKIEKDYAFDPKTVLSNPGDGTIGLIILQSKTGKNEDADFIFLGSSFLRNEDTVKMGEEEDAAIKYMAKGCRQGATSGYMLLPHSTTCYDPRCLSEATHNDQVLHHGPNHKSAANSIHYTNAEGKRQHYTSVYHDMNMSRFTKAQKKKGSFEIKLLQTVIDKGNVIADSCNFGTCDVETNPNRYRSE